MSDNETPTPMTDAVVEEIWKDDLGSSYCEEYVPAEHARNLERQLAEAKEELDGIDQALANAEHWMGKCEELERQIVVISAESEKLKEMVARYLVAIYDVPIRQVDCRMDTDKIDQLHDDIIDEIGQEYIDSAMKGGER
jgi:DNA repair exonuclease SbcCD ATPase subunit